MSRQPRAEAIQGERRRRRDATLDGMENMRLALPQECRDDKASTYRWVNDDGYRIPDLVSKDWDPVKLSKTEGSPQDETRRQVGVKRDGSPLFAVLMKKPIEFHKEDRAAMIKATEQREDNLVAAPDTDPSSPDTASSTYVVKGSAISRKPRGNYAP